MRSTGETEAARRFTLTDAIVMVGATATGLALVRGWQYPNWCVEWGFVLAFPSGTPPQGVAKWLVRAAILSDSDRRLLRQRDVELDEDAGRQLLDERFLAYVAFTRAADRLVLSRPVTTPAGKAANPSPYWAELLRLVPVDPHHVPRPTRDGPQWHPQSIRCRVGCALEPPCARSTSGPVRAAASGRLRHPKRRQRSRRCCCRA